MNGLPPPPPYRTSTRGISRGIKQKISHGGSGLELEEMAKDGTGRMVATCKLQSVPSSAIDSMFGP